MSYAIHADLLTEQKKTAYKPSLSLSVEDNGLLHPVALTTTSGDSDGNVHAAVSTGSVIVRAYQSGANSVYVQQVAAPETVAQWSSWTLLRASALGPVLFWTGTYVVLVYQDSSSFVVYWRRSADGGSTWTAEQALFSPGYYIPEHYGMCAVSGGATRSAIFYRINSGTSVGVRVYDATADTWGTAYTYDYGYNFQGISAAWDGSGDSYAVVATLISSTSWSDYALVTHTYTHTGTWGTPFYYFSVMGTATSLYNIQGQSLAKLGDLYTLCFFYEPGSLGGGSLAQDFYLAYSNDGVYYSGKFKMSIPATQPAYPFFLCGWMATGVTYLVSDTCIYKSTPPTTMTADTSAIISYRVEYDGPDADIEITLDNTAAAYTGIETGRLGADLVLERGAVSSSTARRVALPPFVVSRVRWSNDLGRVTLEGYNYLKLLELWRADDSYYYSLITLSALVEAIAALAGIHTVTFDAASIWSTSTTFTIQPNQSAADALDTLAAQYGFVRRLTNANALYCFVMSSSPTADYVFGSGSGEHEPMSYEGLAERRLPDATHVQVVGDEVGSESVASTIQAESGRPYSKRVTKKYITSQTVAASVAASLVDKYTQAANTGQIVCLPVFNIQPFDVVSSDDWASDQVRYLTGGKEVYDTTASSTRAWYQVLDLAGLGAREGGGAAAALSSGSDEETVTAKRAVILSFNSTTWAAVVKIEGSASAYTIPCGQWLPASLLTVGAAVAVLLFDESNPSDGLVVGPYGAATPVIDALDRFKVSRLAASDGSPDPALAADASGNLTSAYNVALTGTSSDVTVAGDVLGLGRRVILGTTLINWPVKDNFEGSAINAYWAGWAGSPFVTPTVTVANSLLAVSFSSAPNRAFLYSTSDLSTHHYAPFQITSNCVPVSATDAAFIGLRTDNGTDNYYYEIGLRYTATNQYDIVSYARSGGDVTTTVHKSLEYPIWSVFQTFIYGARWSNWGMWGQWGINGPGQYILNNGGLASQGWTATRHGITVRHPTGGGSWHTYYADWLK